jgi:hypothetical protein
MLDIMQDPEFIAGLQKIADADHARQSTCSWCRKPGTPYEHNGVKFDGLVACSGDRLCSACVDTYMTNTPRLVLSCITPDDPGVLYDLNPNTWEWSEKNIPGCKGEPPIQCIAPEYRYRDYVRPSRRRRQA